MNITPATTENQYRAGRIIVILGTMKSCSANNKPIGTFSAHISQTCSGNMNNLKIVPKQQRLVAMQKLGKTPLHPQEVSTPLSGGIITDQGKDKDKSSSSWFSPPLQCSRQINLERENRPAFVFLNLSCLRYRQDFTT